MCACWVLFIVLITVVGCAVRPFISQTNAFSSILFIIFIIGLAFISLSVNISENHKIEKAIIGFGVLLAFFHLTSLFFVLTFVFCFESKKDLCSQFQTNFVSRFAIKNLRCGIWKILHSYVISFDISIFRLSFHTFFDKSDGIICIISISWFESESKTFK